MTESTIFAAGFGTRHPGQPYISFRKAFHRTPTNETAVDDLIEILTELELYKKGAKAIKLSDVEDLELLKTKLEEHPHPGAIAFIEAAITSDHPLSEWFIYIMVEEATRNINEARLLNAIPRPPDT